jgi:lysophospholipase L1-like esterase
MKSQSALTPFILGLLVIFLLGLLSVLPSFNIGNLHFRKIDPLASIREEPKPKWTAIAFPELDSIQATIDSVAEESKESCPPGITCVEDYSPDSTALDNFLKAMIVLKEKKKTVRIAFYGDSFIEGDVFCGQVRDTLQTLYGGRGVGFVPITSNVTGFRNTIKHAYDRYKTYSIVTKKDSQDVVVMGPAGYAFRPLPENWVEYKGSRQRYLGEFSEMRLYYRNRGDAVLHYTFNDSVNGSIPLKRTSKLREWRYTKPSTKAVAYKFEQPDSLQLYGASFENGEGIYVDNFSMRGNSGIGLDAIEPSTFKEFNNYRDYKLIILQYGLNVVGSDSGRYNWYANRMITVIEKIKKSFPKASILLMSVSDKSTNEDGEFKTLETIPALRNTQRYIAQKTGIAFWDLYEAMGGENSMVKFVEAEPALAAKDYTHLTFKGGRKLAGKLVNSLLFELEQFEKESKIK